MGQWKGHSEIELAGLNADEGSGRLVNEGQAL